MTPTRNTQAAWIDAAHSTVLAVLLALLTEADLVLSYGPVTLVLAEGE